MVEEDSFASVENSFTSTEEAYWTRDRTNNLSNASSYKTSTIAIFPGNKKSSHDTLNGKKGHHISTSGMATTAVISGARKNKGNEYCYPSKSASLYGRLYLQPLSSNRTKDNYAADSIDIHEAPSSLTEPSIVSCSSSSFDLQEDEDSYGRISPALTRLENVTETSRNLIGEELLQKHGIGRSTKTQMKRRVCRRRKYRARAEKQKKQNQQNIFRRGRPDNKLSVTDLRGYDIYSPQIASSLPAPALAPAPLDSNHNQYSEQESDTERVPSPALTHLEDVTEVSRALIPPELFESIKRKKITRKKKRKNTKKKKKTGTKLARNKQTNSQARTYRNRTMQDDEEDFNRIHHVKNSNSSMPIFSAANASLYSGLTQSFSADSNEKEELLLSSSQVDDMMTMENQKKVQRPTHARGFSAASDTDSVASHHMRKKGAHKVLKNDVDLKGCRQGRQPQQRRQSRQRRYYNEEIGIVGRGRVELSPKQPRQNEQTKKGEELSVSLLENAWEKSSISPPKFIGSYPLLISPLANPTLRSHRYTKVLSSNSPHYSGPFKSLPSRAPLAMRIIHEMAIGLVDAYDVSGVLQSKRQYAGRERLMDSQLYITTKEKGEEKQGWNTIQIFLSNLQFLVKLVDGICSPETPLSVRQHMKQHVQFRPLRSVIRTTNDVITSRFLVKRIDRHRLLFRIVLPQDGEHQDRGQEGYDSHGDCEVSDMKVIRNLNKSVSDAVKVAIAALRPSQLSHRAASPHQEKFEATSFTLIPKSPPAMLRTTKPNEKEVDDGRYDHQTHSLNSSPAPFAPYVFSPMTQKSHHHCHPQQSSLSSQPFLSQIQGAEEKDGSPARVSDFPLLQDNKTKEKKYTASFRQPSQPDDNSAFVFDMHRASTPILGNISPQKKKTTSSTKGGAAGTNQSSPLTPGTKILQKGIGNDEGLKALMEIIQHLWNNSTMLTEEIKNNTKNDDPTNTLFSSMEKDEDNISVEPIRASLRPISLPQHQQSNHHYRQHQQQQKHHHHDQHEYEHKQLKDEVIQKENISAMEELEALFEVFRERRRQVATDTEAEVNKKIENTSYYTGRGCKNSAMNSPMTVDGNYKVADDKSVSRSTLFSTATTTEIRATSSSLPKTLSKSEENLQYCNARNTQHKNSSYSHVEESADPSHIARDLRKGMGNNSFLPAHQNKNENDEKLCKMKTQSRRMSEKPVYLQWIDESPARTASTRSDTISSEDGGMTVTEPCNDINEESRREDATATNFDWTCTPVDHLTVSSEGTSQASNSTSTHESVEQMTMELKKNNNRVRERIQKLRENKNNGPISNTDQIKSTAVKECEKKHMLATIPTGEPVQQCGDDVDPRILQQQILFLEGLKADKEAAIDRLADTQSVDAPSFRSGASSPHDIRTEDKEGILQRNAGAAALELEVQNLSHRLSNLRKKWIQSTSSELRATRHQHSAANSSLYNIERTDSFLLDSNLVKERKKRTEHVDDTVNDAGTHLPILDVGAPAGPEIVHLRMKLRSEGRRNMTRSESLQ